MNASIAAALPGSDRSTPVGPPLHSTPSHPVRTRSVLESGPAVDRSGGPSAPLARCVGDLDEFAANYWGRRPMVHVQSAGDDTFGPDNFDDVFSLEALDELVAHGARIPTVRMVADGNPLAPSRFCSSVRLGGRHLDDVVDPVKVVARLADGATLVLQSLHRTSPSVGTFVTNLQHEMSHPVQANAYLTPPNAVGLAEHSDLHDVIAVQLHGSKRWWVDGLGHVAMHPGDVMYVPSGVRHRAETATETSLHLTLGVIRVTSRQVIDRLLDAGPELFDAPLPIGYRHRAGRGALERHLDSVLDATLDLIGTAEPGAVARREQSRRLVHPPGAGRISSAALLDRLGVDTVIRWIASEPVVRAVDEAHGGADDGDALVAVPDDLLGQPAQLSVHLGDRTLIVPVVVLDALLTLGSGRQIRVGDLPGLDESSCIVLARRLILESACIIVTAG